MRAQGGNGIRRLGLMLGFGKGVRSGRHSKAGNRWKGPWLIFWILAGILIFRMTIMSFFESPHADLQTAKIKRASDFVDDSNLQADQKSTMFASLGKKSLRTDELGDLDEDDSDVDPDAHIDAEVEATQEEIEEERTKELAKGSSESLKGDAFSFLKFLNDFEPRDVPHPEPLLKTEPFRSNTFTKRRAESFSALLEEAHQVLHGYYKSTQGIKYWEAPIGFASMTRPPRVLMFEGYWWLAGNDGRAGQTLGDITIWVDYYLAMEKLGAEIVGFPKSSSRYPRSHEERRTYFESFDMILCDYDAVAHLKNIVFRGDPRGYQELIIPRLYIQDTFGTEPFYDDPNCPEHGPLWYWGAGLKSMDRYLVMIRHFDESNTFIGNAAVVTGHRHLDLLLQDHLPPRSDLVSWLSKSPGSALLQKNVVGAPSQATMGRPQQLSSGAEQGFPQNKRDWKILLWGKAWRREPHRIGQFQNEVRILAEHIPVIATVLDFPVGPVNSIHPNVYNLGPQSFKDMQKLLGEVAIVVNFGRYSSIGHLATEGLSHGAMLWLADAPMDYHGSKPIRKIYTSTHPHFEEDPGAPMVQKLDLRNKAVVAERLAHFKALHDATSCAQAADPDECKLFKFYQQHGTPVPDFTVPSLLLRLNNLLHKAVAENRL
mmetsp:Transcript_14907/g.28937  ORF Transcript_14907/g.28937 Transcript_14907/m.28937 type:complete len:655 (-) Transcript_14907:429-2393(-)